MRILIVLFIVSFVMSLNALAYLFGQKSVNINLASNSINSVICLKSVTQDISDTEYNDTATNTIIENNFWNQEIEKSDSVSHSWNSSSTQSAQQDDSTQNQIQLVVNSTETGQSVDVENPAIPIPVSTDSISALSKVQTEQPMDSIDTTVMHAITNGKWSEQDNSVFLSYMSNLDKTERISVLKQLNTAVNYQQMKIGKYSPNF